MNSYIKTLKSYCTRTTLIKIFILGLLLQFFLHTLITFKRGIEGPIMTVVRMWKELLVAGLILHLAYTSIKTKSIARLRSNNIIAILQIIFVVTVIITFLTSIVRHGQSLGEFIMAFKYDFFGFLIFFTFYHIANRLSTEQRVELFNRFLNLIKTLLVGGLIWWLILEAVPHFFESFGYTMSYNEADVGKAPPVLYYTAQHTGFIRLQFLFERPISYGFFLTAFWPLFYVHFLKARSMKKTRIRWFLYIFNVVVTFARSARGSIFIQVGILGLLSYKNHLKKFLIGIVLPLFVILAGLLYRGKSELIFRYASNGGHVEFVQQAIEMIQEKPILGRGAATAGPGSHHHEGEENLFDTSKEFNPENQFLQIIVEFGLLGFIGRMIIYSYFIFVGYQPTKKIFMDSKANTKRVRALYTNERIIIAFATGMIGLSISGLVLHSFSDRMIVYPFMALFGIAIYHYNNSMTQQTKETQRKKT